MAVTVRCVRGVEYLGEPEPLSEKPVVFRAERQRGRGGWMARITALDPKAPGGLRREFIDGCRANLSRAGNGVVVFEVDQPGCMKSSSSTGRSVLLACIVSYTRTVALKRSTGTSAIRWHGVGRARLTRRSRRL